MDKRQGTFSRARSQIMCYLACIWSEKHTVRATNRLSLEIRDVTKGQLQVRLTKALIKSLLTS